MKTRSSSRRPVRLLALGAVAMAAAAAPATAHADDAPPAVPDGPSTVRVSDNWELRATSNPIHGRDAIGLAVNPRNRRHIVAVYADWMTLWCEAAVSFNGGRTWRRDRLHAPEGFVHPPCTVGGHLGNHMDGNVVFGSGGNVYIPFASGQPEEGGNERGRSVLMARSTDGGRNFATSQVALPGGADSEKGPDYLFPKAAVEPGRDGKGDRVYLFAGSRGETEDGKADTDVVMSTSTDSGRTWSAPKRVDAEGHSIEMSQPVIGRNGRLYVAWRTRSPGQRPNSFIPEGEVVVARSADRGRTWIEKPVAGVRGYVYEGPAQPPFQTVQSYTNSTFPRLAADRRSGAVYLVYGNGGRPTAPGAGKAHKADHFIHPDSDVWFQRSPDGGRTWDAAMRINDELAVPTETTQTRHPNVFVAPDGRVDLVWHDRRHWYRGCLHTHSPCVETRLGDTYYSYSHNGGRRFSEDRRVTDRSINLDVGYDYRFGVYWEYGPQLVHTGKDSLLVGWMDSRKGNFDTDIQGLYLARVDHTPRRSIPKRSIRARSTRQLSVELSRRAYPAGPEAVLGGTFATRPWTRVVIVNERDQQSALAAGVLARANIATVLLSGRDGLSGDVKDEVARMQPVGAYVIGSERNLSDAVVRDLAEVGVAPDAIERIVGTSRADTARLIAKELDRRTQAEQDQGKPAFDAAILVNPATADAYTASVLAATRRLPILFVGEDSMPEATRQALAELDIARTLAVGGEDEIGDGAVRGLPLTQRLGGSSTLNTSRAVLAESRRRGLAENNVYVATGRMDSALLGPAAARIGGLQLKSRFFVADGVLRELGMRYDVDRMVTVRSR